MSGLDNAPGAMAESIAGLGLPEPGAYWLVVDRVSGPACDRIAVDFGLGP